MDAAARDRFVRSLGPGLIWAAAAIGVSHLVQSTRAGATFGVGIIILVLLANLLKYPFFEFGPRYAAATGESLLEGYRRLGRWPIAIYIVLSIGTTFTIMAAVTIVTASLATQLFSPALTPLHYAFVLLALCTAMLMLGQYPLLDKLVKVIVAVLAVSSLAAVFSASTHISAPVAGFRAPELWSVGSISFIVALIGWMPSAIDISVWHSLWTLERARQTRHRPSVRDALIDFNIGYLGTAVIAVAFVLLGAFVMYGSGESFSPGGASFARQLVNLYTINLGEWARPVILVAAFTAMFSTTLTAVDAFSRVLRRLTGIVLHGHEEGARKDSSYRIWMLIVVIGALLLLTVFRGGMTVMVDVATTLSFLTAPVLGYLNLRAVQLPTMPEQAKPGPGMVALSWAGIGFGAALGLVFLVWRFLL